MAVLRGLSHFVRWAGRYPDPGAGREDHAEEIFRISEHQKISARDLFEVAGRVSSHVRALLVAT